MESERAARAARTFVHVFAKLCKNNERKVTVLAPTQTDNWESLIFFFIFVISKAFAPDQFMDK